MNTRHRADSILLLTAIGVLLVCVLAELVLRLAA